MIRFFRIWTQLILALRYEFVPPKGNNKLFCLALKSLDLLGTKVHASFCLNATVDAQDKVAAKLAGIPHKDT